MRSPWLDRISEIHWRHTAGMIERRRATADFESAMAAIERGRAALAEPVEWPGVREPQPGTEWTVGLELHFNRWVDQCFTRALHGEFGA